MERRLNISPKFIAVLAIVLALIIAAAAWMNRSSGSDGDGTVLSVCVDGEKTAEYTLSEIMKMDPETQYMKLQSAKEGDEAGDFTGVPLDELLKEAGISKYKTVVLSAGDGYSSAADSGEASRVLVAYSRNEETLGYFTKGGTGPMRAVFCDDTYGNRSIKYLTKIDCRTGK